MDEKYRRRSIRLRDYDYSQQGAYFVTVCTYERRCLFGEIVGDTMMLNDWGRAAQACWDEIPAHHPMVGLDSFVVMPNHIHGVIVIYRDERRGMIYHAPTARREFSKPDARSLGSVIGTYKAAVTRVIRRLSASDACPVWQRNYYEHIIRSEEMLNVVRAYVVTNPAQWAADTLFAQA
jgi:REP element-mobilizing transposase RayT